MIFPQEYPPYAFTNSSFVEVKKGRHGNGVFATRDIAAGVRLLCYQGGLVVSDKGIETQALEYLLKATNGLYYHPYPFLGTIKDAIKGGRLETVGAGAMLNSSKRPRNGAAVKDTNNIEKKDVKFKVATAWILKQRGVEEGIIDTILAAIPEKMNKVLPEVPFFETTRKVKKGEELRWKYTWI